MITEIEKFFEDRKAVISKHSLCKEAGLTTQLLGMIFRGERKLTEDVQMKLLPVLQKYGFQSSTMLAKTGNSVAVLMAVLVEFRALGITADLISDNKSFNEQLSKCDSYVVERFKMLHYFHLDYARNYIKFDLIYADKLADVSVE